MNFKKYILYLGLAIIFFSLGFGGGYKIAQNRIKIDGDLRYGQGWEDAKKRFGTLCVLPGLDEKGAKTRIFHGVITEARDGQIVIDSDSFGKSFNEKKSITVSIGGETEIKRTVRKEDGAYQKELAEYRQGAGAAGAGAEPSVLPPSQFEQVKIESSSLKTGEGVTVTAVADVSEDDKEVTAAEILVDYGTTN